MQVVQQNDGEILQNNVGTSSIESENQPQSDTTTQGNGGGWWPFGRKAQQPSLMFGKRKKEETNQRVANNLLSVNTYQRVLYKVTIYLFIYIKVQKKNQNLKHLM